MKPLNTQKYPLPAQYIICIAITFFVASLCYSTSHLIGHRVVALVLLMTTSLIAILFDILPVLITAVLSAIIWNFFFIPPLYTFHIDNAEDFLMFLLYFVIALVNGVLTFKIKKAERKIRDKEEKENTIKLYNTLLNSLSHELRTPISTIIGAVDTLKENKAKLSSGDQATLLSEIDTASIRLNRQVENLLNMSRLENGMLKPKIDWCDVNALIHAVIQKVTAGNNHNIMFEQNDEIPLFKTDEGLLEQVLYNLIHNAIQYSPKHTAIKITAGYLNHHCVISVSDSGKGVPAEETEHVFEKFYRLPNTKAGGSGLGLSIVKGFTEALGGTATLSGAPSGGAMFTIKIPAETSFLNNLKNE